MRTTEDSSKTQGLQQPHPVAHVATRHRLEDSTQRMRYAAYVRRLTFVGVAGNIVLTFIKMIAGFLGNSTALIADGVHSFSDVLATIVAAVGAVLGKRKPDATHPYGHDRFESVASLILAGILCIVAFDIGKNGVMSLISGTPAQAGPSWVAFVIALVSIAVKEAMFWYTLHGAKKIQSSAFEADAWHHRSDAISSVIAALGIVVAKFGFVKFDIIASILIAFFVGKIAYEVVRDALGGVLDEGVDERLYQRIQESLSTVAGLDHIDELIARKFASKVHVDISIAVAGDMSVNESHKIAHMVHDTIIEEFADIDYVMVHVNPAHV